MRMTPRFSTRGRPSVLTPWPHTSTLRRYMGALTTSCANRKPFWRRVLHPSFRSRSIRSRTSWRSSSMRAHHGTFHCWMEQRLRELIAGLFKIDPSRITDALSPGDVKGWDSLGHLSLIEALETHFEVSFEDG